jgi:hypothetical protein
VALNLAVAYTGLRDKQFQMKADIRETIPVSSVSPPQAIFVNFKSFNLSNYHIRSYIVAYGSLDPPHLIQRQPGSTQPKTDRNDSGVTSFLELSLFSVGLYLAQITAETILFTVVSVQSYGRKCIGSYIVSFNLYASENILFSTLQEPSRG